MRPAIKIVKSTLSDPFVFVKLPPSNLDLFEKLISKPISICPFEIVERIEARQTSTRGVE